MAQNYLRNDFEYSIDLFRYNNLIVSRHFHPLDLWPHDILENQD
jgi:hypothetical protein